jgi:tripartite-type tricarboxylate transporter receptor subunit TctC
MTAHGNGDGGVCCLATRAGLLAIAACNAAAADFPTKPIRLIVPQTAGGQNDIQARLIGQKLTESLGQTVVVDNRPGAAGAIGFEISVKAPADGYTLLLGSISTLAVLPSMPNKPQYDVLRDFAPVTLISTSPYVLVVHPALAAKSVAELVTLAKAKPGALTYASSGTGSGLHLATELFAIRSGVKLIHVPYKGSGPATVDLVAGQVQMMLNNILPTMPHVKTGRPRALAVTTAARSTALPELPTIAESGYPGYEANSWQGIVTIANTPKPVMTVLHREIVKALQSPEAKAQIGGQGSDIVANTPEEFTAFIKGELAKWSAVIKTAGVRPE